VISAADETVVNCRIETVPRTSPSVVRVSGRLAADHVPDLMGICANRSDAYRLDLSELLSVDCVGLQALRQLRAAGAEIVRMSPFIALLLGDVPGQLAG
jgi:anti-anti-sigma regulatory factor